MFHMPGRWDLQMDVRLTDGTRRLRDTLTLP
jgi:hypothetical protein